MRSAGAELPGNVTGLAGHRVEMTRRVGQEAMPALRIVAGLAICRRQVMIRLLQVLAHGFPPRFAAQDRRRPGLAAETLGIIGGIMAVTALHQFAGVNIPGEMELWFAG